MVSINLKKEKKYNSNHHQECEMEVKDGNLGYSRDQ